MCTNALPCNKPDIFSTKVSECFYITVIYVYKCIARLTSQIYFSTNYINECALNPNVYRSEFQRKIQRIITLYLYEKYMHIEKGRYI